MRNQTITIELSQNDLNSFHDAEKQPDEEIKLWAAVGLFQTGKVSIGKAASIAGLSRFDFENFLADNNIPISNLTAEDIEKEYQLLKPRK